MRLALLGSCYINSMYACVYIYTCISIYIYVCTYIPTWPLRLKWLFREYPILGRGLSSGKLAPGFSARKVAGRESEELARCCLKVLLKGLDGSNDCIFDAGRRFEVHSMRSFGHGA